MQHRIKVHNITIVLICIDLTIKWRRFLYLLKSKKHIFNSFLPKERGECTLFRPRVNGATDWINFTTGLISYIRSYTWVKMRNKTHCACGVPCVRVHLTLWKYCRDCERNPFLASVSPPVFINVWMNICLNYTMVDWIFAIFFFISGEKYLENQNSESDI